MDELSIRRGETLAIVGPNGAGKSTLLLALAGLLRPDRGSIVLEGVPVVPARDLAYRRRIGLVFPAPLLLSTSVYGNVAAGLRFRGVGNGRDARAGRALAGAAGDRRTCGTGRPAQLSSGEAQRTSLARALVLDPHAAVPRRAVRGARQPDPCRRSSTTSSGSATRRRPPAVHRDAPPPRGGPAGRPPGDPARRAIRQCDTPAHVEAAPVDDGGRLDHVGGSARPGPHRGVRGRAGGGGHGRRITAGTSTSVRDGCSTRPARRMRARAGAAAPGRAAPDDDTRPPGA